MRSATTAPVAAPDNERVAINPAWSAQADHPRGEAGAPSASGGAERTGTWMVRLRGPSRLMGMVRQAQPSRESGPRGRRSAHADARP